MEEYTTAHLAWPVSLVAAEAVSAFANGSTSPASFLDASAEAETAPAEARNCRLPIDVRLFFIMLSPFLVLVNSFRFQGFGFQPVFLQPAPSKRKQDSLS
jgi:hypothetical protein